MRVLITTAPGYGHLFAPVPLAWALRGAGHEVVLATAARPEAGLDVACWSGLPVVELASADRIEQVRVALRTSRIAEAGRLGVSMAELGRRMREQARQARYATSGNPFVFAAEIYGPISSATADGLLRFGRRWKPDILVYETLQAAGPLAAAVLGVPAVEYTAGLYRGAGLAEELARHLAEHYERHGQTPSEMKPDLVLDTAPPGMATGGPCGRPMKFVPFNGPAVLEDWLWERPARPRVCVTFGSVVPHRLGNAPLRRVVDAARQTDAEFVLAVGVSGPSVLGELPENVRPVGTAGYLPLTALLPSCHAVIHHGGPASTLAALDVGVPQLVLPEMADQFVNAGAIADRGCGFAVEDGPVSAQALARLLTEDKLAESAARVRGEMAAMPSPADVVPELIGLAG